MLKFSFKLQVLNTIHYLSCSADISYAMMVDCPAFSSPKDAVQSSWIMQYLFADRDRSHTSKGLNFEYSESILKQI